MKTKTKLSLAILAALTLILAGCDIPPQDARTSDQKQAAQQETILQEGTAQTGMPAIKNFRERKLMKDILEMRDQNGLVTYTYLFGENSAKVCFFGNTVGYGLPYSTQYTNPQKIAEKNTFQSGSYAILPQADPNGLFSPQAAEGTWILMKDPKGTETKPVYIEPRILTTPFKLEGADPCYPGGPH
ncbi:MAG: hypothetical protein KW788_00040 [Candidatus Doudnabacteria bacterium]|nr:hypothetical protein [Candidatus Doudnabacteria bacterium]